MRGLRPHSLRQRVDRAVLIPAFDIADPALNLPRDDKRRFHAVVLHAVGEELIASVYLAFGLQSPPLRLHSSGSSLCASGWRSWGWRPSGSAGFCRFLCSGPRSC